jgi:hypothetical protein
MTHAIGEARVAPGPAPSAEHPASSLDFHGPELT